jgi:Fe-S-cluster containining protein
MRLHEPEFMLIEEYIRSKGLHFRVHFEKLVYPNCDKREFYKDWVCPLYNKNLGGCSVYPVRPFACRIYGAYKGEGCSIEGCVFEKFIPFKTADDIPIWKDYMEVINSFKNKERGYIYPDSMLYGKPTLEFLFGYEYPWSYSGNYPKGWKLEKFYPMPIDQLNSGFVMKFGQSLKNKC